MKRFFLILIGIVFESLFIYSLFYYEIYWIYGLFIHFFASVLFSKGVQGIITNSVKDFWIVLIFCNTFFIYGYLGTLIMIGMKSRRSAISEVFHVDIDEDELGEEDFFEIEEVEILETESFADILKGEDKKMRLGAITALQKLKDKSAIELITDSLDNTYQEVRYYAVEALNQIAQEYLDKIGILKQLMEIKPNDKVFKQTYAEKCFEYAEKGLEEESIQHYYFKLAQNEIEILLINEPDNIYFLNMLMKIQFYTREYENCENTSKKLLEYNNEDQEALIFYLDSLINLKAYEEIIQICNEISNNKKLKDVFEEPLKMWSFNG